jgi:hypothetical protein
MFLHGLFGKTSQMLYGLFGTLPGKVNRNRNKSRKH